MKTLKYYQTQLVKRHEDLKYVALGFLVIVALFVMIAVFSFLQQVIGV